jgi:hypothetical protein
LVGRGELTDVVWERMEPLLPSDPTSPARWAAPSGVVVRFEHEPTDEVRALFVRVARALAAKSLDFSAEVLGPAPPGVSLSAVVHVAEKST